MDSSSETSPRRLRCMERLARSAEELRRKGDMHPEIARRFGMLAMAARCGAARAADVAGAAATPTTVDAGETTLDLS